MNIVLVASNGFALRNYLLSDCVDLLVRRARVIVMSPLATDDEFVADMERRGVDVLPLQTPKRAPDWQRVRRWREALHVARVNTRTHQLKRSNAHLSATAMQRLRHRTTMQLARVVTGEQSLRWLDRLETRHALETREARQYRSEFERLKPAVVFSAAPLNPDEWLPIQVARDLGIPTVLSVLSWDNLSSKSRIPLPVEKVLVWSETMRREFLDYYPSFPAENLCVTGAPQFDFYRMSRFWESRESFMRRVGLDPARPLIVYAGVTESLMPNEPRVVAALVDAIRRGEVEQSPQLLLRLHPKDDGKRYVRFRDDYPEVAITVPGERSHGHLASWSPDIEDVRMLVNTIRHGDVHINVASTMTIDAAVADKPIINIAYDLRKPGVHPSWGIQGYEFTHYEPVVQTGGVRVARTPVELTQHLNTYLAQPELERSSRRRIVEMQCGEVDGKAAERIANALLQSASPQ